uniref:Imidazole glycerol phosphate synthase subunit HisH n=1 Tax=Ignisphaera aggregans TaxID=334771 RepID=A0A7C2VMM0_9CREN
MRAFIINYGVGNLHSLVSSLRRAGFETSIEKIPRSDCDLLVLPGVGSSAAARRYLDVYGDVLRDTIKSGVMTLGICLGMQLLFEYSLEHGYTRGLGLLDGYVDRIPTKNKLPHMGWNKVYMINRSGLCTLFEAIDKSYTYFMHSYMVYPRHFDNICLVSLYGVLIPAGMATTNIVGVQFHPEKSGHTGLTLLNTLARWVKG